MTNNCTTTKKKLIPIESMKRMSEILRHLAHPHRLQIIEILETETKGLPAHAITIKLGLDQAATSRHLNSMKRMDLLEKKRKGKEVWYRIKDNSSLKILDCIRNRSI